MQHQGHVHYPPGDGRGHGGACRSCNKLPVEPRIAAETGLNLCRRCHEDRELGRRLLTTHYLAYRRGVAPTPADTFDLTFFEPSQAYTLRLAATPDALANFTPLAVESLATEEQCAASTEESRATTPDGRGDQPPAPVAPPLSGELCASRRRARSRRLMTWPSTPGGGTAETGRATYLGVVKLDVDQLGLLPSLKGRAGRLRFHASPPLAGCWTVF